MMGRLYIIYQEKSLLTLLVILLTLAPKGTRFLGVVLIVYNALHKRRA